jgi:hypothetical protein
MALSFAEMYRIAYSETSAQLPAALALVSVEILAEDPATDQHASRLAWAQKVLANPQDMARKMIWVFMGDRAEKWGAVTDQEVLETVRKYVNGYLNA